MSSFGTGIPVLGAESLTYRRYGTTTWDSNGRPTESSSTATIEASVDPASGVQVQKLTEQDRQRDPRFLITLTKLKTADQGSQQRSDEVQIATGEGTFWYEVIREQHYKTVLPGYAYLVLRVKEEPT